MNPSSPLRSARDVRVLVADDHRMFAQALQGLLTAQPGIEPVGIAGSVDEALDLADSAHPDVVLMDIDLPGPGGIEGTRQVRRRRQEAAVVVVASQHDPGRLSEAIRAGALGFILKTRSVEDLVSIIRQASQGGMAMSLADVPHVLGALAGPASSGPGAPEPAGLTSREMEVLRELASGRGTDQIADALFISVLTVRSHVKSILAKLGVHSKLEAVTYAIHRGLVEVGRPA